MTNVNGENQLFQRVLFLTGTYDIEELINQETTNICYTNSTGQNSITQWFYHTQFYLVDVPHEVHQAFNVLIWHKPEDWLSVTPENCVT